MVSTGCCSGEHGAGAGTIKRARPLSRSDFQQMHLPNNLMRKVDVRPPGTELVMRTPASSTTVSFMGNAMLSSQRK